jgi:hypothetical protein
MQQRFSKVSGEAGETLLNLAADLVIDHSPRTRRRVELYLTRAIRGLLNGRWSKLVLKSEIGRFGKPASARRGRYRRFLAQVSTAVLLGVAAYYLPGAIDPGRAPIVVGVLIAVAMAVGDMVAPGAQLPSVLSSAANAVQVVAGGRSQADLSGPT